MKFFHAFAVFCLIAMLSLSNAAIHKGSWVSPCKLKCDAEHGSKQFPCIELSMNLGLAMTPEDRAQFRECMKPYEEAHKECMKVCTVDEKPPANFRVSKH